jgi:hypothetical protein
MGIERGMTASPSSQRFNKGIVMLSASMSVGHSAQAQKRTRRLLCACALVAALSFPAELGVAKEGPLLHPRSWPIYNGLDHQPTEDELRALHQQDVTPNQAREIDKLYDQLLSTDKRILGQHSGRP